MGRSQRMPEEMRICAHIGSRISERRIRLGMTQAALGERINVSFQQIQKYEYGGDRVSAARLLIIANELGVTPMYFYRGYAGKVDPKRTQERDLLADPKVRQLLEFYQQLPEHKRSKVLAFLRTVVEPT